MKHVTLIRVFIAAVILYFPIATLGKTGSYWDALQSLVLILSLLGLGFYEGRAAKQEGEQ